MLLLPPHCLRYAPNDNDNDDGIMANNGIDANNILFRGIIDDDVIIDDDEVVVDRLISLIDCNAVIVSRIIFRPSRLMSMIPSLQLQLQLQLWLDGIMDADVVVVDVVQ